MTRDASAVQAIRWLSFRNDSNETVPPFGVLKQTGTTVVEGNLVLLGDQPDGSGSIFPINGAAAVPAGEIGECTLDTPWQALYDGAGGTPAAGDLYGPQASAWSLKKGAQGFVALSGPVSNLEGIVPVAATAPGELVRVKTTAGKEFGEDVAGEITAWDGDSYEGTGEAISLVDAHGVFGPSPSGAAGFAAKLPDRPGEYEILYLESYARFIAFTTSGSMSAGLASATANDAWGAPPNGRAPGGTVTVQRHVDLSDDDFPSGTKGVAALDETVSTPSALLYKVIWVKLQTPLLVSDSACTGGTPPIDGEEFQHLDFRSGLLVTQDGGTPTKYYVDLSLALQQLNCGGSATGMPILVHDTLQVGAGLAITSVDGCTAKIDTSLLFTQTDTEVTETPDSEPHAFTQIELGKGLRGVESGEDACLFLLDSEGLTRVDDSDALAYLEEQFADHHETPEYSAGTDTLVEVDTIDVGGDKQLRLYFETPEDKYVAVNSDDTPDYLEEQFSDHNASPQYASGDLALDVDTVYDASDYKLRIFIDASAISNYSGSAVQLLGHDASGGWKWYDVTECS